MELFSDDSGPFQLEEGLRREGFLQIAGVDEVGRGALAGPVVAAAIILSSNCQALFGKVRDSKKLSPSQREKLFPIIMNNAISVGIGSIDADEIDRTDILTASLNAMVLALRQLTPPPDLCLIDGKHKAPIDTPQRTIIKGDDRVLSIGAASIIAKVTRDRWMEEWACRFPQYGFERHRGYGTETHYASIRTFGVTSIHRRSFLHL